MHATEADVFLCYIEEDKHFAEELITQLKALRSPGVSWTCRRRLPAGLLLPQALAEAIAAARVGVVLLSAALLADETLIRQELEPLLAAQAAGRLRLIPVHARHCLHLLFAPLSDLKFPEANEKTLAEMAPASSARCWQEVIEGIRSALATPAPAQAGRRALVLSPQRLDEIEACYLQALRADRRLTTLQVLEMRTALPIEQVYIRLRLHEERELPVRSSLPDGQAHDPQHLQQLERMRLEQRFASALEPQEALRRHSRCVILGDPGAGKTTLLKHLTVKIARGAAPELPPLPVYLNLNAFTTSGQASLLAYAAWTLAREYGHQAFSEAEAAAFLEQQLVRQRLLFLLDGLDETLVGESFQEGEESYRRVAEAVLWLANRAPVAVTARRAGYRLYRRLPGFDELDVLDFRHEEIREFIGQWFGEEATRRARGERLRRELFGQPHMLTLAANPLLLTLIVLTYEEREELPERRAALYEYCMELLLTRWDRARNLRRVGGPVHLRPDQHRRLLNELAWQMHLHGWRYAPRVRLEETIAAFLRKSHLPEEEAPQVLQTLSDDRGLLREQGRDLYGFLHLTLQEYCAARYVSERGDLKQLLPYLGDPWWEEVILLYAGATPNATPLLLYLLGEAGEAREAGAAVPPEDIFLSRLLLAGRCLAEHVTLEERHELRTTLPERLLWELQRTPYTLTRRRLAEVLVQIGRAYSEQATDPAHTWLSERLLTLLRSDSEQATDPARSTAIQRAITEALGTYGAPGLAPRLLACLEEPEGMDPFVNGWIETVVWKLADEQLLSRLIAILETRSPAEEIWQRAARLVGRVGDAATARRLLPLLRRLEVTWWNGAALLGSLARIGDEETVEALLDLVTTSILNAPGTEKERLLVGLPFGSLLQELAARRYRRAAPRVLAMLRAGRLERLAWARREPLSADWPDAAVLAGPLDIGHWLAALGDAALAGELLALVEDAALPLARRCISAAALASLATNAPQWHPTVLSLLARDDLPSEVRCAIALALGESGERALAPALYERWWQEPDPRVKEALLLALVRLDEDRVLPAVEARLQADAPKASPGGQRRGYNQDVLNYLARHSQAESLVALLGAVWLDSLARSWLALAMGRAGRRELQPALLALLERRTLHAEVRTAIATAIGELGETRDVAQRLLAVFRHEAIRDLERHSDLVDALFEALWRVTRRAGLLVVEHPPHSGEYQLRARPAGPGRSA